MTHLDIWKFPIVGGYCNPNLGLMTKASAYKGASENDVLPSHGGETHLRVSQSQVAELRLGSTLPASNSRKG